MYSVSPGPPNTVPDRAERETLRNVARDAVTDSWFTASGLNSKKAGLKTAPRLRPCLDP